MKKLMPVLFCSILAACGGTDNISNSCELSENTSVTSTVNSYGCAILSRDTSSCQASRTAQGLTGFWLNFSCRVTLTKSGSNVLVKTDSQPDRLSSYFESTNSCYEAFSASGRYTNPNTIVAQDTTLTIPFAPTQAGATSTMAGGAVGLTLDGVVIYDNEAAPGDDIYDEVASFDQCEGHPDNRGMYHHHTEPPSITNNDSNLIGVMRDGFPVYGRLHSGSTPGGTDAAGGHVAATDSGLGTIYHYHVNLQTSGADSAYFITKGLYRGTAGACSGC